jgi:hypothetical protein
MICDDDPHGRVGSILRSAVDTLTRQDDRESRSGDIGTGDFDAKHCGITGPAWLPTLMARPA